MISRPPPSSITHHHLTSVNPTSSPRPPAFPISLSQHLIKGRNQRLRQPKAKHQLRPRHQQLGGQPLEETGRPFLPRHPAQDLEAGLGVLEVAVLDPGLDHVERGRDEQGGGRAAD